MINRRSRNLILWLIVAAVLFILVNVNFLQPRVNNCDCPECPVGIRESVMEDNHFLPVTPEKIRKGHMFDKITGDSQDDNNDRQESSKQRGIENESLPRRGPDRDTTPFEPTHKPEQPEPEGEPEPEPEPETNEMKENEHVQKRIGRYTDDDDYPAYLSYGQYTKEKMYEVELRERVDPRIKANCKFCEYPLYERIFHHQGATYSFGDSLIGDYGDTIFVIANRPASGSRIPSGAVKLEIFPIDESFTLKNEETGEVMTNIPFVLPVTDVLTTSNVFVFKFSIKNYPGLLDTCFHVQMKEVGSGRELLKKRLYVRHCYQSKSMKDKEKPDQLAVCTMFENRDRFIVEWIEWHRIMGATHFYLYFHPGGYHYYDRAFSILEEYMKDGIVSLYIWNYTLPHDSRHPTKFDADQIAAQNDCVYRYKDKTKYMAFIDDDEYLVPTGQDDFLSIMNKKTKDSPRIDGFFLNNYLFGPGRSTDTHLSTSSYFRFDKVEWRLRKTVGVLDHINSFTVHNVEAGSGGGSPKLEETGEWGAFLAHYYYRKWHDYNKITEKEDNEGDLNNAHFKAIDRFHDELKRRVDEYEKRVNFDQYNLEYHERIDPP